MVLLRSPFTPPVAISLATIAAHPSTITAAGVPTKAGNPTPSKSPVCRRYQPTAKKGPGGSGNREHTYGSRREIRLSAPRQYYGLLALEPVESSGEAEHAHEG